MRLARTKDDLTVPEPFDRVLSISNASFDGVERPPLSALRYAYDMGEVFIYQPISHFPPRGFAIMTREGGHPYLWSIATHPEWRGGGTASHLLNEVVAYCQNRNEEYIDLTVNVDNPAQKLYFDYGFRVKKVTPRYYGESAGLRMRRKI